MSMLSFKCNLNQMHILFSTLLALSSSQGDNYQQRSKFCFRITLACPCLVTHNRVRSKARVIIPKLLRRSTVSPHFSLFLASVRFRDAPRNCVMLPQCFCMLIMKPLWLLSPQCLMWSVDCSCLHPWDILLHLNSEKNWGMCWSSVLKDLSEMSGRLARIPATFKVIQNQCVNVLSHKLHGTWWGGIQCDIVEHVLFTTQQSVKF